MLREFKFLRRNSTKNPNLEESENVPVNPHDSSIAQTITDDSSRPPLNTIQEPVHNPKSGSEQEVSLKSSKADKTTPTKAKGRYSDGGLPIRTPEKQGSLARNYRFGWGPDSRDEGKVGNGNVGVGNINTPARSCRTVGRTNSGYYSECNSTQSTPTKSVSKPPNPGMFLGASSRSNAKGGARTSNFTALSRGIPVYCNSSTVVNTIEVPHFDLKEDPSFWMDHNVQVLIRIRPLNGMEISTSYNRCLKQESAQCLTWIGHPETRFTFDHIACETIDQETLFRMVGLPMVENCLSGYNSCMFAYGQTGSGKTHTMLGEVDELELKPSLDWGMTPRMFEFLFARIIAEEESRRDERLKYTCKCSFLEIYNEQITDLLDPSSTNLQLREDVKKGVYVENLSEFEVHAVGDILKLLSQGSSNRRVAATNMNRESSRSHSVFTCIIESRWEKDSSSNLRFARLNLVDLAGSERQKTSGAEGERLKEAANINKSLSTLGHVIMVLVDVANTKTRHIPYRDSRLTFLLQDSLGGNSKTMIIANVSPSICCAAETLNTLKFAQRAKLIQNNAVVNEDSSGDVMALQHQIRLLKEELATLKRHNISRALSFGPTIEEIRQEHENDYNTMALEMDGLRVDNMLGYESKGTLRVSSKQLKSLETTLTGALRREKMTETSIKQLEAEIEQLNRLVRQREEDSRCSKMMLKFREDKIQRMESLLAGLISEDAYLLEENNTLSDEIQMLRAKVDRNPEVTRFALENIRLLEQLRRFQDFYEEGEREMLLTEVSQLRDQLILFLDGSLKQENHTSTNMQPKEAMHAIKENDSLQLELKKTMEELEECRSKLNSCLERNVKLSREIDDLNALLSGQNSAAHDHDGSIEVIKESILEAPSVDDQSSGSVQKEKNETLVMYTEEVMDLQLEVDILKIILKEERCSHSETEEKAINLSGDLKLAEEKVLLITRQFEDVNEELQEAKSVIEALESQQLISINELEDLRKSSNQYVELLHDYELKFKSLNDQIFNHVLRDPPPSKHSESEDSPMKAKLNKMQDSLEKAKRLNLWYQTDRVCHASNEEEMDEVRRQVEAETAEVIVCLQEELGILQQQVHDSSKKERETEGRLTLLQTNLKELQEKLYVMTQCNINLGEKYEEKDKQLKSLSEEWDLLTNEIEEVLTRGHDALDDASDLLEAGSGSFPERKTWISEQLHMITRSISEKELRIKELTSCLEDANNRQNDMESMLRSLRGAALVITEAHQQDCSEKDKELRLLASQSNEKSSTIAQLENKVKQMEEQIKKASVCATVAFVIVNRFSEMKYSYLAELAQKDAEFNKLKESVMLKDSFLHDQEVVIDEAVKQVQSLRMELEVIQESYSKLSMQLSEEKKRATDMEWKLDEIEEKNILETREKLTELKTGVSIIKSCMNEYVEQVESPEDDICEARIGPENSQGVNNADLNTADNMKKEISCPLELSKSIQSYHSGQKIHASHRDTTIILLKKEMESALESLKGVQTEMAKLHAEKEEVSISDKQSRKRIELLVSQVLALQAAISAFEEQLGLEMVSLDHKLRTVEEILQESSSSWFKKRTMYELELRDAKVDAAQQAAESSCILAKFVEAQDTIKEADIMINELMLANETMKLEIEELKSKEVALINEKDILKEEVLGLQNTNSEKDCHYAALEKQLETDTIGMKRQVEELEDIVLQIQTVLEEDFMSVASDFFCMKSQLHDSSKLMRSCLEDIWSEIIAKDCAVSVLHVCHMGILLEAVTGLNAENGLLYHGLCESNSAVSQLREHNSKSRKELEMCRVLKGKLLSDIKNGFDRISRKEDETGKLSVKISSYEKRILDLQLREELMLQRSNYMGSELAMLMREMELSNKNVLTSLMDQEKLLKDKDEALSYQEEKSMMDLSAKDFELFILTSELEQMALQRAIVEKEKIVMYIVLEKLKEDMIICNVDTQWKDWILLDKEVEVGLLQKENVLLRSELRSHERSKLEDHNALSSNNIKCISMVETIDVASSRVFNLLSERSDSLEKMFEEMFRNMERMSNFIEEFEGLENLAKEVISENLNLQTELKRKDEVLEGLVFDLRLLQESASNTMDQKVEIEELEASLESLEEELDETIATRQALEAQLQDKVAIISTLEADVVRERDSVKSLSSKILLLTATVEDVLKAKESTEEELTKTKKVNESMEMELIELGTALGQMNNMIESLNSNLNAVSSERDDLHAELLDVKKEFEMAQALAEENEAIAVEARQVAETRKLYAEDKEEEVKLLERSVEELERTVNVLESKVDMVKGEAERQRLQREELELELHSFKQQMQNVRSCDTDTQRHLEEKEKKLQEALQRIQLLEKEIATKDEEVVQHKAHINELILHAEAQAREYKQTFKVLEAMADQVKPDGTAPHISNSSSNKLEKNGSKSRGSGSPFKCIGMGLVQQMKSERDEELMAARFRIEELESLSASQQKEIFTLHTKLATAGSMTHDVIRDLLGIKSDMNSCASLMDIQKIETITEKVRSSNAEAQVKEQEIIKLKQHLNGFVEERKGWLEEIDRKQAEMVATQIALEKLRQRDRLLTTENEMFKVENVNHKKKVMELEAEVKKLSGQQNLQQRIHHHAKIKEENNMLKVQNEDLGNKLRRTEAILSRVKEELAHIRAANGRSPHIHVDVEQQLNDKLKETEEERLQLAQKLVALCTSILKAAGVTRPSSDMSISLAEEALEQLHNRVTSLERELRDVQLKNRISNERIRLSELIPQSSPLNSREDENQQTPNRTSQTLVFSAFDR